MTITTIHGDMDDSLLDKLEGGFEDDNEQTSWVEYRLKGDSEIVHRSVRINLKQPLDLTSEVSGF